MTVGKKNDNLVIKINHKLSINTESQNIQMKVELNTSNSFSEENLQDYVTQLQVHMSLQSRNLLPHINASQDKANNTVYQTQVNIEKLTSRALV